jgi:hypothetical protein
MKKILLGSLFLTGFLFASSCPMAEDCGCQLKKDNNEYKCEMKHKKFDKEKFKSLSIEEKKDFMSKKISDRMEKMSERKSCIEKSITEEDLKSCIPEKRK